MLVFDPVHLQEPMPIMAIDDGVERPSGTQTTFYPARHGKIGTLNLWVG